MTNSTSVNDATIAIIVPVYNNENDILRCIDSCLNQTDPHISLILVDDGSTDKSAQIIDEAALSDQRIRCIHKSNEGLTATWRRGVLETDAPYLMFLDGDDYIEPNMVAAMRQNLSGAKEIVCCSYTVDREWNGSKEFKTHGAAPGIYEGDKLQKEIKDKILGNEVRTVITSRCMKIFSRSLIEDNLHYLNYEIKIGEDMNITTPAILDAERIVLMSDPFYHYIFAANSMVHQYNPNLYHGICILRDKVLEVMQDKRVPNAQLLADREFLFLFFQELKNELRRTDAPANAVVSRVKEICQKEDSQKLLAEYPGKISDKANMLLSFMMKKPNSFRIRLIRRIFLLHAAGNK